MHNPIISTGVFGPVYKRKIDVYKITDTGLVYAWSTNAYKTCRDAVQGAKNRTADADFCAYFGRL